MAINRVSFSAESIKENTDITIELLEARPVDGEFLDTPVTPNRMVGFYNSVANQVELFISDPSGYRYLKVR